MRGMMQKSDYGDQTVFDWSVNHIASMSEDGTDHIKNLVPLQGRTASQSLTGTLCAYGYV